MSSTEPEKRVALLFTIIAFVVLALAGLWYLDYLNATAILVVILVALVLVYTQSGKFFAQVEEFEKVVVFRFGKFVKVAGPGWVFIIPFIETMIRIDQRIHTIDVKPQDVITKDNIKVKMDAVIYLRVKDPKMAIIAVEDYHRAAVTFVQAHMRDIAGTMPLTDLISNIEKFNYELKKDLAEIAEQWGVLVDKVEIQTIELPPEIIAAMSERKAAEQKKLAMVEKAEARKLYIEALQKAAGQLTSPSLQYLYLQSLQKIAEGKSSKIIFPMELSRLAEGISNRLGKPYSEAQSEVLQKYRELTGKGEAPRQAVRDVAKEEGLDLPEEPRGKEKPISRYVKPKPKKR
ncbi:hypothetical protein HYS54_00510 [Candidatus Micrarchaeota archaeon]|nr:hypothetical protein [Candidatus Micrarchaeota archaeon]